MTGTLIITPAATNANAINATGNGLGAALEAVPGAAQTNAAPKLCIRSSGYVQLFGTDPDPNVDPGENNVIHGASTIKAWGTVSLTGGTPFAVQDGYNVTNVTEPIADIYQINFVRAMANTTYSVVFAPHSPSTGVSISTKTTTTCRFNVWDTTTGNPYTGRTIDFQVVGRQ
jgi:hypothetical protein